MGYGRSKSILTALKTTPLLLTSAVNDDPTRGLCLRRRVHEKLLAFSV